MVKRRQPKSPEERAAVDIDDIDLSTLDLSHIDLEVDDEPSGWARWLGLALLLAGGGLVLWLPGSEVYRSLGSSNLGFFVVCGVATILGIALGRWLLAWAEESARRYAARRARSDDQGLERQPPGPPSALKRWVTLIAATAGGGAIVFGAPTGGYLQGDGSYTAGWFVAAGGAVAVGILVGRWLVMESSKPVTSPPKQRQPIVFPPWWKWVTFAFLLVLGLFAMFGGQILRGSDPEVVSFGLGGVGFVVGILGAIWLARRFDEAEKRLREEARRHRRPGAR